MGALQPTAANPQANVIDFRRPKPNGLYFTMPQHQQAKRRQEMEHAGFSPSLIRTLCRL